MRRSVCVLALAAVAAAGCGAPAATEDVDRVATEWLGAAAAGDAARLCALLSPAAAESAATGDQSCEQAVGDLELPGGGSVSAVEVWSDEAQVRGSSDTLFLVRLADGWRVSAAGCTPRPDRPYDCDVAG